VVFRIDGGGDAGDAVRCAWFAFGVLVPSADTLLQSSGGGEVSASAIDENNDDSTVSDGGEFIEPTCTAPATGRG